MRDNIWATQHTITDTRFIDQDRVCHHAGIHDFEVCRHLRALDWACGLAAWHSELEIAILNLNVRDIELMIKRGI